MGLTKVRSGGIANNALNVPAFHASLTSDQSISNATYTRINFDTELFDSDGTYDNSSNYRFTPAVAGKYYLYASVRTETATDFNNFQIMIRKNNSDVLFGNVGHVHYENNVVVGIVDSDSDDYFDVFMYQDSGGSVNARGETVGKETFFGGFRITT